MLAALKIFASDLVVCEGEEAVVVQQHVDQVGELALVARGEEAVTDHVDNLQMMRSSVLSRINRLNLVKRAKFQKCFFRCFFFRYNLSRVDLIIDVVIEFLSNP